MIAQILELYKQYVDPEFTWSNFTLEEQAKVIVAPRWARRASCPPRRMQRMQRPRT